MRGLYFALCLFAVVLAGAGTAVADIYYDATLDAGWHIGSGMSADHFSIYRDDEVEIGLKAHERFAGDLPVVGNVYMAPSGTSWYAGGGYDVAKWNFNASIFFDPGENVGYTWTNGLAILDAGVDATFLDTFGWHNAWLYVDFDPSAGDTRAELDLNALLQSAMPSLDLGRVIGLQLSENVMFHWLETYLEGPTGFNPYVTGEYAFNLHVESTPKDVYMKVFVPVPAALLLGMLGLGAAGIRLRRFV